jgi:hypothetical protein
LTPWSLLTAATVRQQAPSLVRYQHAGQLEARLSGEDGNGQPVGLPSCFHDSFVDSVHGFVVPAPCQYCVQWLNLLQGQTQSPLDLLHATPPCRLLAVLPASCGLCPHPTHEPSLRPARPFGLPVCPTCTSKARTQIGERPMAGRWLEGVGLRGIGVPRRDHVTPRFEKFAVFPMGCWHCGWMALFRIEASVENRIATSVSTSSRELATSERLKSRPQ